MQINSPHRSREKIHPNPEQLRSEKKNSIHISQTATKVAPIQVGSLSHHIMAHSSKYTRALCQMKTTLESNSLLKVIQCQTSHRQALKFLKELNANEIKSTILRHVSEQIYHLQQSQTLPQTHIHGQTNSQYHDQETNKEEIQRGKQYLATLIKNISTQLREHSQTKKIYQLVNLLWTNNIQQDFLTALANNNKTAPHKQPLPADEKLTPAKLAAQLVSKGKTPQVLSRSSQLQSNFMSLVNQIQNQSLAKQLYSFFTGLTSTLKEKQSQLLVEKKLTQQLSQLLQQQVTVINQQQEEQEKLATSLKQQYAKLEEIQKRCQHLENQLNQAAQLAEDVKEENEKEYLNNLQDEKMLTEQKFIAEIVQLESDLYFERNQTSELVDLFLTQVELAHKAFEELGSSYSFICKFDRQLYKKLKMMKAFDKVKLKELLELKEQDSSEQMLTLHKSTISTYSSIELEGNRFSEFISETRSEHSS